MRHYAVLQTATGTDEGLAGAPTLRRWENRVDCGTAWQAVECVVEQSIRSHRRAPEELILDIDATDDPAHGKQEGRLLHGLYH